MDEFIAHWLAVNAALRHRGEPEMVLRDGCTVRDFVTDRARLETLFHEVDEAAERPTLLRQEGDYLKEELRARLVQFQAHVLDLTPDTPHARWAEGLLVREFGNPRYLGQLDTAAHVWAEVNAMHVLTTGDLLILAGGHTLTDYRHDIARFRSVCRNTRQLARVCQELYCRRAQQCAAVMERLMKYRSRVRFDLDVGRELLASLPARTPGSYRPGVPPR